MRILVRNKASNKTGRTIILKYRKKNIVNLEFYTQQKYLSKTKGSSGESHCLCDTETYGKVDQLEAFSI